MKRMERAYWFSWVLLLVYIPMVLLSSVHVHFEWDENGEPCLECLQHTVHDGHISAVKAHVDCPLCAFQNNVYQAAEDQQPSFNQTPIRLTIESAFPALALGFTTRQNTRAPPFTFCA